jgi:hypothetical protein
VISRRDLFGLIAGLTSAGWLRGQDAQRPVSPVKADKVVVGVSVIDENDHYIIGLKPGDFRVFEDDIPQKIYTFAEGRKPPLVLNDDGTTKPLVDPKLADESGKAGPGWENSYIITYYPDPSNTTKGYRIIKIQIIPDVDKKWRVRARPGYRPNWPKQRIP